MADDPDLLNFFKLVNQDMASRMVGELFTGFLDEDEPPAEKSGNDAKPLDLEFLIKVLDGFARYLSGTPQIRLPLVLIFQKRRLGPRKRGLPLGRQKEVSDSCGHARVKFPDR